MIGHIGDGLYGSNDPTNSVRALICNVTSMLADRRLLFTVYR